MTKIFEPLLYPYDVGVATYDTEGNKIVHHSTIFERTILHANDVVQRQIGTHNATSDTRCVLDTITPVPPLDTTAD